ncbi:MAG: N-acetylneuraminate synthase family protein, partial [bacterium]|nr:N-acetylneuraminate synthase family protein [bacterium]
MKSIELATKSLGPGHPCFIIAEGGLNHNGDPVLAADLIAQAAACGADAIKFQTYTPAELFPPDHPDYQKFQQCVFSRETYVHLQSVAAAHRILLLSTPFDEASADLLESLDLPAFKIGSGELTHLAFLRYVAQKGKPILLSTGMSTPAQVDRAVEAIQSTRPVRLALLHCVSAYPCPVEQANIRIVAQWMRRYPQCPIGYSDHTPTLTAALAAVALG